MQLLFFCVIVLGATGIDLWSTRPSEELIDILWLS